MLIITVAAAAAAFTGGAAASALASGPLTGLLVGAIVGAATGAIVGGVLFEATNTGDFKDGAIAGAVAGAVAGALVGAQVGNANAAKAQQNKITDPGQSNSRLAKAPTRPLPGQSKPATYNGRIRTYKNLDPSFNPERTSDRLFLKATRGSTLNPRGIVVDTILT